MINFSEKYNKKKFQIFLKEFLPKDLLESNEELKIQENNNYFQKAILLGSVKSLEGLVIIEVERKKSETKVGEEYTFIVLLTWSSDPLLKRSAIFRFTFWTLVHADAEAGAI